MMQNRQISVHVARVEPVGDGINAYMLKRKDGGLLPRFTPGAHIDLFLENGMVRQYSLCNDPENLGQYRIAVYREPNGRGGSEYIHTQLAKNSALNIGEPRNNFELDETAERYLLVAGGIGITPLIPMAHRLRALNKKFDLYYLCRGPKQAAFCYELEHSFGENITFHFSDVERRRLDLRTIFNEVSEPTQVYTCGPEQLITGVLDTGADYSNLTIKYERFAAARSDIIQENSPFQVRIASTGETFEVTSDESLLQALRRRGHGVTSLCEEGICGSCCISLLEGEADHRDFVLTDAEKSGQTMILACCSRAKSASLTLDL